MWCLGVKRDGSENAGSSVWPFDALVLEVTWHYFCPASLVEAATEVLPRFKCAPLARRTVQIMF